MDLGAQMQSMVLSLALVVGLMLLLAWLVRTLRGRVQAGGHQLEVLSATHVGPKERIVLVRVRDRELLLGVGPQSVTALGEFAAPTALAPIETAVATDANASGGAA